MCRLQNIALESVTCDRRTDRQTDRQTDDGQSDPYGSLCFAGDTKSIKRNSLTKTTFQHYFLMLHGGYVKMLLPNQVRLI